MTMLPPTYPTSAFDFVLPESSIAQSPSDRRDASRLMVVDRAAGTIAHRTFADLAEYVPAGDVLVRNTTKVIRARLLGTRDSGAPAEVMLLKPLGNHRWEAMVHPGGKLKPGRVIHVAPGFDVRIDEVQVIQRAVTEKDVRSIDAEMNQLRRLMGMGAVPERTFERARDLATTKKERLREGQTVDGEDR